MFSCSFVSSFSLYEQSGVEKPTIGPSGAETTTFDEQRHSIERVAQYGQGNCCCEDCCCCCCYFCTAAMKTVVVVAIADIRLTPTFRSRLFSFSSVFSAGTTPVPSTRR